MMTRHFCDHCGKELHSGDERNRFVIRFRYSPNCPIGTDQIEGCLCPECTVTVINRIDADAIENHQKRQKTLEQRRKDAEERRKRMMDGKGVCG